MPTHIGGCTHHHRSDRAPSSAFHLGCQMHPLGGQLPFSPPPRGSTSAAWPGRADYDSGSHPGVKGKGGEGTRFGDVG